MDRAAVAFGPQGFHAPVRQQCSRGSLHADAATTPPIGLDARLRAEVDVVSLQADHTVHMAQAACFDQPVVVDDRFDELIGRLGAENDLTAIGLDESLVFGQGVQGAPVHGESEQAVAVQVEGDLLARRQRHGAAIGGDRAFIADPRADQRHIATAGAHCALVEDRCADLARLGGEGKASGQEIVGAQTQRRSNQTGNVDLCTLAEQHAIGVEDEDLAIGVELAQDAAAVRAKHAVQRDGTGAGLQEVDALVCADVEALPVDGKLGTGLMDGGGGAALADVALPGADNAACGFGPHWRSCQESGCDAPCAERLERARRAGAFAQATLALA